MHLSRIPGYGKTGFDPVKDLLENQPDEMIWDDLISTAVKRKYRIVEQDFREQNSGRS